MAVFGALVLYPGFANIFKGIGSDALWFFGVLGLSFATFGSDRPKISPREKLLMWVFGAYFGLYLLSAIVNTLNGNLPRIEGRHFEKEAYLLFFIPILFLFKKLDLPRWTVWYGACLGGIMAGGYAMLDFGWIDIQYRVRGAYNPIMFGCLSLTMGFLALQGYWFYKRQNRLLVWVALLGFIMGCMASLLTGSRSAWIAIPALGAITVLHLSRRIHKWVLLVLVVVFSLAVGAAYRIPETGLSNRIAVLMDDLSRFKRGDVDITNSTGLRLASWQAAWRMASGHLLLGVGPGGYPQTIDKLAEEGGLPYDRDIYHSQPHSLYIAVLVDCGLPGLVCLLLVFGVPLWIFLTRLKQPETNKAAAFGGLILVCGYMHFSLTETVFGRNLFVSFYLVMLAALLHLSRPDTEVVE
jgi:O-antigen ligase